MKTRARAETSRRIVDAARRTVAAVVFVAAVAAPLLSPPAVTATSDFAAQTGKDCAYCHVTPGGPLAAAGVEFREDGYRLPPEGGPTTTTTTSAVDDGPTTTDSIEPASDDVQDGGPILDLPRSERLFFRWLHILAAVAWLGGIISVFVVQTPQVAFAGIPTRYLALAWPSLLVTGVTGVVLTLAAVQDFGALSETRWGRILLLKMALYLALLVIALLATFVIGPRLKKASSSRPSRGRSQEQYRAQGRVTV